MRNNSAPHGAPDYDVIIFVGGARGEHCAGEVGTIQLIEDPATAEA